MDLAAYALLLFAVPVLLFWLLRKREPKEPTFHHSMAQHQGDAPSIDPPQKALLG